MFPAAEYSQPLSDCSHTPADSCAPKQAPALAPKLTPMSDVEEMVGMYYKVRVAMLEPRIRPLVGCTLVVCEPRVGAMVGAVVGANDGTLVGVLDGV